MTDPTQQPEDEFASAFAELQTPAPSTPTAAAAATAASDAPVSPSAPVPAAAEATPSAAAAPSGTPEGNASGTSAPATPAAGAEAGTPTAAQPAATPSAEAGSTPAAAPDLAAQFAALQAELAEMKKPAAAPTPTPAAAAQPKPIYSDDEQGAVDAYVKEWPDVARGEALMRRAEYQQLVQYVWQQFAPRLDALEQVSQRTSTRTQYQELKELVPDYDAVRDPTLAWIDTQPAYLKDAYQRVANEGSAKDVADLITRFRKETGYAAPAVAATPAAVAATPAAAVAATPAPAAAAAAAALRPVATSRSTPVSTPDPNDFDAAFKEFATAG